MRGRVILLVKPPNPLPLLVFESDIDGNCEVLQQTPRAIIAAPPSAVTSPAQIAVVEVMSVTSPVMTEGFSGGRQENNSIPIESSKTIFFIIVRFNLYHWVMKCMQNTYSVETIRQNGEKRTTDPVPFA